MFAALEPKKEREVRSRFDLWIDGGKRDSYFHGWPGDFLHKECFVFKWKEHAQHQRLYGFLFHPTPVANSQFQVCILVSHAAKNEFETDQAELNFMVALRDNTAVIKAITTAFPDAKDERRS